MRERGSSWRTAGAAAGAAFIVQFALVAWTFPLGALLSDQPLLYIDSAFHWYQIHVARELGLTGRLTGYDPYFAAGHLGGVTLNVSARIPGLIAVLFGRMLSEAQVYKLFAFSAALFGPPLVPIAARIFGLDRQATWIAAGLGLCAWWASAFRWYHTAGMVSFVIASYVALPYTGLLLRLAYGQLQPLRGTLLLGAIGALGFFLHPLFPIPVAFMTLSCLAVEHRSVVWTRAVPAMSGVAALAMLANLPWIIPMLGADATAVTGAPFQQRVDIAILPEEMLGLWRNGVLGSKLYPGLVVASLFAACAASTPALRRFAAALLPGAMLLALFACVGAAIPGAGPVQPNRFSSAAYLFLVLPAAVGFGEAFTTLRSPQLRKRLAAVGVVGLCALSYGFSAWETLREVSYADVGHYGALPPEVRGVGAKSRWLIAWISANTTPEGRVLFETSKGRIHDHAHMAGYYAIATGREFIGGPYPFMLYPSFWDGEAFGRTMHSIPVEEFRRYLTLYNIGWIIAHTPQSQSFLATVPGVARAGTYQELNAYRVEQPLSYFLVGSGKVRERAINRVVLSDLSGSDAVIKYHYVPGLHADPPTRLAPFWVAGIRRPFVRLSAIAGSRVELSVP